MPIPGNRHCPYRNKTGSISIEIVFGIIIFVGIVLLFFDMDLLLGGAAVNDSIARDAARSAAMGPPGKLLKGNDRIVSENQSPYLRALAVVTGRRARLLSSFELAKKIEVKETVDEPVPSELFGGPVLGTVTVASTILIHPKFILGFFWIDAIKLTAVKTFPYSWVVKSQMDVNSENIRR